MEIQMEDTSPGSKEQLRKLGKGDLIEIIYEQKLVEEALRLELRKANEVLTARELKVEKAGSIAEAAMTVNGVFEAAQKAADDYLSQIKKIKDEVLLQSEESLAKTKETCKKQIEDTEAFCRKEKEKTERFCEKQKKESERAIVLREQEIEASCVQRLKENDEACRKLLAKTKDDCEAQLKKTEDKCRRMEAEALERLNNKQVIRKVRRKHIDTDTTTQAGGGAAENRSI